MADEVVKKATPVQSTVTWSSRIGSLLIAVLLVLQQFGVITPEDAAKGKDAIDRLTPLIEQLETAANDIKKRQSEPPPPTEVTAASISPDQIKQWVDLFTPLIRQIVDDLKPKPKPDPLPDPTPKPDPKPKPKPDPAPTDGIKAVDADGKIHVLDVESGHQFKVVASQPGLWGYEPKSTWIDVQQYPDHAIVTLRDDPSSPVATEITLAHSTATSMSMLRVKCQHAAQPPPTPIVDDVKPKPNPTPTPGTRAFQICVVRAINKETVDQNTVINSSLYWSALKARGHDWYVYQSSTAHPAGAWAVNAAATKGVAAPCVVVVENQQLIDAVPLPATTEGIDAVLARLGGK